MSSTPPADEQPHGGELGDADRSPTTQTHSLLRRQVRRAGISGVPTESQWQAFMDRVDRAYHEADRTAAGLDHLLAVSSNEIRGRLDQVAQLADERVAAERIRMRLVFGSVTSALTMFDRGGRIVAVNAEAERLLGAHHDVIDHHLDEVLLIEGHDGIRRPLVARADLDDVLQQGRHEWHDVTLWTSAADPVEDGTDADAEAEAEAEERTRVSADVVIVPFADDDAELGGLVVVTDNAERERARERLAWLATHDPLTGLVNRDLVTERIELSLAQARTSGDWPSVLFVDLDRFRPVNDQLGHAFGDRVLVTVAERLERCVRGADTVARLGGDEFVILCESAGDSDMVQALAERVLRALAEPFDLGDEHTVVTASIGIAHAEAQHPTAEALLHDADLAKRGAKQRGRNCSEVADDRLRVDAAERGVVERELRGAITRREIGVAYQPLQRTGSGDLVGFEALARWVHPILGDVRPDRFVPIAVETGLIEALGDRMFDLACRDVATWNRERKATGLSALAVHVNISGRELRSPNLLARVRDAMRQHSVLPAWMVLEITETMLLHEPEIALERLRELKRAGIRVAIDDYGTGYSSLANLRRFPVHMVKIDREFISEIATSKQGQAIVKAMIDLAVALDHEVIAEGVETGAELDVLRNLGCDLVQGYLLGMPMPSENALLLATSCRTETQDLGQSASAGTAHLLPQP